MQGLGYWLWIKEPLPKFNRFIEFRKTFDYTEGKCDIKITGDTRFVLYVNGEYVGYGPARCWPNHYKYDIYDLKPYMNKGKNTIAVLLIHYNTSTFQSINCEGGLYCEIDLENETLYSDKSFKVRINTAYKSNVHRISVQQGFEEIYNANNDDDWRECDYNDDNWEEAFEIRPFADGLHNNLTPKDTLNLTMEPVSPKRIVSVQGVKSCDYFLHFNIKEALFPNNRNSNRNFINVFVATYIVSDRDTTCKVRFENIQRTNIYVNGKAIEIKPIKLIQGLVNEVTFDLKKGYNDFLFQPSMFHHLHDYSFAFICDAKLEWTIDNDKSKFGIIGPFELPEEIKDFAYNDFDDEQNYVCPEDENVSVKVYEEFLKEPVIEKYINTDLFKPIDMNLCPTESPYFQSYTDMVKTKTGIQNVPLSYLLGNNTWTKIEPSLDGDIRILFEYEKEITGYQTFEFKGPKGVILDFHNFEFIQPDGVYNYAEGMRNSIRYISKEGYNKYQSLYRRGFRYSYLTIRNLKEPMYIRNVRTLISSSQCSNQGYFYSSDYKLNKIFDVCVNSARNCSEDTYTDCPTYEQTTWLGDAQLISLSDSLINGNFSTLYRSIVLGGQSLERSEIVESQVPSGWQNILPGVVSMWMDACCYYYKVTGDKEKFKEIMVYLKKNFEGIKQNINSIGLFEKRAWNVCDWAPMDTPVRAVVTFVQLRFIRSLEMTAKVALELSYETDAEEWKGLANALRNNVLKYMWNEEKQAFTDCIRLIDGVYVQSPVYSQQTQTWAYLAKIDESKTERLEDLIFNTPEDFVKAGSSAYEDLILYIMQEKNETEKLLSIIRNDWGFMLDKGATTFWEMWTYGQNAGERLTRSHCHGYSSTPAYYLLGYILGITPGKPGFEEAVINPHLGDLSFVRGAVNTKYGRIEVHAEKTDTGDVKIDVKSPVPYKILKSS
ncbi:MAG: hypothetical protein IJS60_07905 [Abditibacteriota bacterium]|nr:hypothetical protein [Abditibacteriota bacterium]